MESKEENMKEWSQLNDWTLKPQVKLIVGYTNSVIYDFEKKKAYQISKFAGIFLEKVFKNEKVHDKKVVFKKWMKEERSKLSSQVLDELFKFLNHFKEIGILIPVREMGKEKAKISKFKIGSPISNIPTFSILECTSRCNFQCPHCYLGNKHSVQELDFGVICDILTQLQKMKTQSVLLTGGEICLRKDLGEIITFAHRLGLKIEISTNGSLLSKELIEIVNKYVNKIQITFYGLSKETYSRFSSNPNTFDKVISAIEEVQKRNPAILLLTFTLTPYNYQDLTAFLQFSEKRKLRHKIGRTLPLGLALTDKDLLPTSEYGSFIGEFEKQCLKEIDSPFQNRFCPSDRITILSNGKVTICPLLKDSKFIFGDAYHYSLEEIWHKKMRSFFNSLLVDKLEICRDCELKYLCGGGCPALWHILEPLKKAKTPPCKSSFLTTRYIFEGIS